MDNYTEQILQAKPTFKSMLAFAASVCLTVFGVILIMFTSGGIGIMVIVVGAVLIVFTRGRQSIEYEYLIVNGDCDIACIYNKSSRKTKFSFTEGDVLRILPYDSDKCQNELQVNHELTVKNFTSGDKENSGSWYAFFVTGKGGTTAVILELNQRSLEQIRQNYKSKFE
jgi:hypothetical protein